MYVFYQIVSCSKQFFIAAYIIIIHNDIEMIKIFLEDCISLKILCHKKGQNKCFLSVDQFYELWLLSNTTTPNVSYANFSVPNAWF